MMLTNIGILQGWRNLFDISLNVILVILIFGSVATYLLRIKLIFYVIFKSYLMKCWAYFFQSGVCLVEKHFHVLCSLGLCVDLQ